MSWTEQQKLEYLLTVPWTIYGEASPDGERLLRVRELPSVIGSGATEDELEQDFWESLEATLRSFVHFGDQVPMPLGLTLPWTAELPEKRAALPQRRAFRPEQIDQPGTAARERWEEPELARG